MQLQGVIDSLYTKQVNTKRGPADVYHAVIDGHDVNLGFRTNKKEGEYFNHEVQQNKFGEYEIVKGSNSNGAANNRAPANNSKPAAPAAKPHKQFPVEINTKDTSIIRQNALTNAREAVCAMMALEGNKKFDDSDVGERIIALAYQFADFSTGQREVKAANAKAAYMGDDEDGDE